ncbi:hypothetical protein [Stenotrophomonas sp. NRRL B-14846]|uniref:hypothetical protein n=1 Tax=Stenotrophomonas sp. NRRL B-14846 TaxID=3162882 RepID=UPI003D271C76
MRNHEPACRQLAIDFTPALERAQLGMERAVNHATGLKASGAGQALDCWSRSPARHAEPFLIEEARRWAEANGLPPPPDARSWGAVTKRASIKKRIEKAGAAPAASSNCSLKPLWRFRA